MINFDNSATSFPKPRAVRDAVSEAMANLGGNPGRSGHSLSIAAAEAVYAVRQSAADFFGGETDNTVFTSNCTHSLNIAVKGVMRPGDHAVISNLEHNSSARPVYALSKKGCTFSIAEISEDDGETARNFERLIGRNTRAVVCTLGSNVTGRMTPWKAIGEICRRRGVCFIADGAQACGAAEIKLSDGINILCAPGHKSLYGPPGTGLLITDGKFDIRPLTEGGTGSTSMELEQPSIMPDRLESGTLNTCGIIGLGKGLEFVSRTGTDKIYGHETMLCERFIEGISGLDRVKIYRGKGNFLPIVSFNIKGITSNEAASLLSDMGYALRGGLHCSGLAHRALGTAPEGTVRFSPSVFNRKDEVDGLIEAVKRVMSYEL